MAIKVAIIGRPNVGKSTLFNRLVGRKIALVDDRPGVTRDRREGEARLGDIGFTIIDTAGLEEADEGRLSTRMRAQTETAMGDADVILFVIDSRSGLTPSDRHFANLARRSGKPAILLANKAESRVSRDQAMEAFELGLGEPVAISAEHGDGLSDLRDALVEACPALLDDEEDTEPAADDTEAPTDEDIDGFEGDEARPLRLAVVGRPNAGKSTLVNRLLGEERMLTGPEAGITRDAISIDWEWQGRKVKLFDTAGLRKRARIDDKLEKLAAADGIRAARFAEVVVVLLDATIPFEKQDLTIADLIQREGRAIVIAVNKWDLVADRPGLLATLKEEAERLLPQMKGVPLVPVSAASGQGLERLMQAAFAARKTWSTRISTSRINRWLEAALAANPPPAVSGRRIKIRYVTQPKARPPLFAVFGNQLDSLPESYRRYLVNGLRETFELPGVPIRLSMRTSDNPFAGKKRKS
jgi:GTP-binding protein